MNELDLNGLTRVHEAGDILASADAFGRFAGEMFVRWFVPWWTELGLPTDEETGSISLPKDVMLHAGALAAIVKMEFDGYGDLFPSHLPKRDAAISGFLDRFLRFPQTQEIGDEGAKLMSSVADFYLRAFAPASYGALESETHVRCVGSEPEADGLDCLAVGDQITAIVDWGANWC